MMKIANNYDYKPSVSFAGKEKVVKKALSALEEANRGEIYGTLSKKFKNVSEVAEKELAERVAGSKIETKIDNALEKYFTAFLKFGKKLMSGESKDGKLISSDKLIEKVTRLVLWGNVLKEVVGTALYTTQAMTNEDLPKEKRKFVGMYDLFVGIVSTSVSFLFGVGLQKAIKNGYTKAFAPAAKLPKTAVIAGAAASFTSFVLQTIVGKRIVAPAIATPWAGKVKAKMMAKDEAKRAALEPQQPEAQTEQPKAEEKVTAEPAKRQDVPRTRDGYVDLKAYLDTLKEQQN